VYKVEVSHTKDLQFRIKSPSYELNADAKAKDGITPPDLLLAALASCIGIYISKYSQGANLGIEGFKISAEADFCKEGPLAFKEIKITVDLGPVSLDERRERALADFIKNCPVHNTLKGNPQVEIRINGGDKG
jgi:uncharacterized OsmC-like protein